MKTTTNTKLFKYCLALIPGILALGIAPDAQALNISVTGGGSLIPESGTSGLASSTVMVNSVPNFIIEDVTVTLTNLTHTWAGDLEISLTNESTGTSVLMRDNVGSSDDFSGTHVINDAFGTAWTSTTSGNYASLNSFSAFDGELANGDWTLGFNDTAGGDSGSFDSWTLALSDTAPSAAVPFEFSPGLGLLLVGAGLGLKRGQDRWRKKPDKVHLS